MGDERHSYLGVRKDIQHEFKTQEADLDEILAEVVAFMNTEGGEIVLGVDGPGPKSVAISEPGVSAPQAMKDRLEQSIPSRIDPPPPPGTTEISIIRTYAGSTLVRIGVAKSTKGPHALRQRNAATFWVREGPNRRALSVGEAYARVCPETPDPLAKSNEAFHDGIACAREGVGPKAPSLFVGFQPTSVTPLTEAAWAQVRNRLVETLSSETPLGLRHSGFTFALWPHWQPETPKDRVVLGRNRPLFRFVEVQRNGVVWGAWSHQRDAKPLRTRTGQQALGIPSMVVVEFVVSVARLALYAMSELGITGGAVGRIAMFSPTPILMMGDAQAFGAPVTALPLDTGPMSWNRVMDDNPSTDLVRNLLTRWFDLAGDPEGWRL